MPTTAPRDVIGDDGGAPGSWSPCVSPRVSARASARPLEFAGLLMSEARGKPPLPPRASPQVSRSAPPKSPSPAPAHGPSPLGSPRAEEAPRARSLREDAGSLRGARDEGDSSGARARSLRDRAEMPLLEERLASGTASSSSSRGATPLSSPHGSLRRAEAEAAAAAAATTAATATAIAAAEAETPCEREPRGAGEAQAAGEAEGAAKAMSHRARVAQETLATETTYVRQLKTLLYVYVEPVKGIKGLTAEDLRGLFSNIETIVMLHENFLEQVAERVQEWTDDTVLGDLFAQASSQWFKVYKSYINNCCRLDHSEQLEGLSIEGFLILPVQRIPRYVLLVKELVRCTSPGHRDSALLSEALAKLLEIADYINEAKRATEDKQRVASAVASWKRYTAAMPEDPHRLLLRECTVDTPQSKGKLRLWLFTDLVVVTSPDGVFRAQVDYADATLARNSPVAGMATFASPQFAMTCVAESDDACAVVDALESLVAEARRHPGVRSTQSVRASAVDDVRDTPEQLDKYSEQRLRIVRSLAASEQEHVRLVDRARRVAGIALRTGSVPPHFAQSFARVCEFLESAHAVHTATATRLEQRAAAWESRDDVADVFDDLAPIMEAFGVFAASVGEYSRTRDSTRESSAAFAETLLPALEKVAARLSQYGSALRELRANTGRRSKDVEPLERLLVLVDAACTTAGVA
eukprot:m51a1_g8786 putative domain containing protein (697) ;mRNA; f:214444-216896